MDERIHSPHLWRLNIRHILISISKLPSETGGSNYGPPPRPALQAVACPNNVLLATCLSGQFIRFRALSLFLWFMYSLNLMS